MAGSTGKEKAEVIRRMKGRISIDLCRAQSRALHRRKCVLQQHDALSGVTGRAVAATALEAPPEHVDVDVVA